MDRKTIIKCVFLIAISFIVANIYTYNYCSKQYKVLFNEFSQYVTVENFEVVPEDNTEVNLLRPYFHVDVKMSGAIWPGPYYISHIRKSERIEKIDGNDVVIVELEPQLRFTINPFKLNNSSGNFSKSFKYKLYGYDRTDLTYIFRCGDFEEIVYAEWWKEHQRGK